MTARDKIIGAIIIAMMSAMFAEQLSFRADVNETVISLGNRTTAIEHQIVTDTQFLALMNKMDQRLTIQETLLRQVIKEKENEK